MPPPPSPWPPRRAPSPSPPRRSLPLLPLALTLPPEGCGEKEPRSCDIVAYPSVQSRSSAVDIPPEPLWEQRQLNSSAQPCRRTRDSPWKAPCTQARKLDMTWRAAGRAPSGSAASEPPLVQVRPARQPAAYPVPVVRDHAGQDVGPLLGEVGVGAALAVPRDPGRAAPAPPGPPELHGADEGPLLAAPPDPARHRRPQQEVVHLDLPARRAEGAPIATWPRAAWAARFPRPSRTRRSASPAPGPMCRAWSGRPAMRPGATPSGGARCSPWRCRPSGTPGGRSGCTGRRGAWSTSGAPAVAAPGAGPAVRVGLLEQEALARLLRREPGRPLQQRPVLPVLPAYLPGRHA